VRLSPRTGERTPGAPSFARTQDGDVRQYDLHPTPEVACAAPARNGELADESLGTSTPEADMNRMFDAVGAIDSIGCASLWCQPAGGDRMAALEFLEFPESACQPQVTKLLR